MFFNGHNHTMYSNLRLIDCINKPKDLIDRAIKLGLSGIAITDHEALCCHIEVNQYAKQLRETNPNFTIALGNEIYLTETRDSKQDYYHFILIAKDAEGHRALRELSSIAWMNSYTDRRMERTPILKSEVAEVMKWAKGHLIATTACIGGEASKLLLTQRIYKQSNFDDTEINNKLHQFINWCINTFGQDDFYIECAPGLSEEQIYVNKQLYLLARSYGLKMVPATDSHYLSKDLRFAHKAYLNSKDGDREVDTFYEYCYLMDEQEAREKLNESFENLRLTQDPENWDIVNWLFENTEIERQSIQFYDLTKPQQIPTVDVKNYNKRDFSQESQNRWPILESLWNSDNIQERAWINDVWIGLREKLGADVDFINDEKVITYIDRLEIEADVIKYIGERLGTCLFAYFNTFKHYIDLFWECGSIVGPGRGSSTGFLSNYLLGITQLDPIKWNLPWWRFLNKERAELPDIDIDLAPSKRPLIFEKIREERGQLGLLQVATFGTEGTKSAIQTACRGYRHLNEQGEEEYPDGIDNDIAQYISSLIPQERGFLWSIADCVYGNPSKNRRPVKTFIHEVEQYEGLLDIIKNIEGIVKNRSIHASGTILYDAEHIFDTAAVMKATSGDLITCYDLHMAEAAGDTKYDFLVTEICDKMIQCLELLKENKKIEDLSLRELYNKYLHPEIIDTTDTKLWDALAAGTVLDVFQFNGGSGLAIAKALKPRNPLEMTAANAMMRLMNEPGVESQQERYLRIKKYGINSFDKEMKNVGLPQLMIDALHEYCDTYYGCVPIQEQMMQILMDERIAGFSLKDANDARKIVAKKQMNRIPELHDKFYKAISDVYVDNGKIADYVWDIAIRPQLGYAFSLNHSLPYSFVGIQALVLALNWNSVYWNTACLIVNSGAVDADSGGQTKYDKIAKAIGDIMGRGIRVMPPNVNRSGYGFEPDEEENVILYGLKALVDVGEDVVASIIEKRPYESLEDFMWKTKLNKKPMISLIKSGALDSFGERKKIMYQYLWMTCDKKKRITLQNMNGLIQRKLLPEQLNPQRAVFEFNRYLKDNCKHGDWFILDERALNYINSNYSDISLEAIAPYGMGLHTKIWDNVYQKEMDKVRDWMKNNQQEALYQLNKSIFMDAIEKYAQGNYSSWEMETMCFYYHEHELAHINKTRYGLIDYYDLPEEPVVESYWKRNGRDIPLFQLARVYGTVIAKDKIRSNVILLGPQGVFIVRCNKEFFAMFDKQISQRNLDGTKHVIEKSWFHRGSMLVFTGIRRGDEFVPKKYSNTPGHLIYKIDNIEKDGTLIIRSTRAQGIEEEDSE